MSRARDISDGKFANDLTVDTNTLKVDSSNNRTGLGNASPETTVHIEGDVSGLNDGNVMHIESNGDGGNRGINIGQEGDGSQARMFLQGYHSQAVTNYWDLLINPYGGHLAIGSASPLSSVTVTIDAETSTTGALELNGPSANGHYTMLVNQPSGNSYGFLFRHGGTGVGSIRINSSSTSYNTSSDYRLKEAVADMTGAIDRVKALAPKRFQWVADDDDRTVDGFLAHEAQAVVPEAVTGTHNEIETWTQQQIDDGDAPDGTSAGDNKLDGDGNTIPVMQGIDQSKLVPLLTGALQEAIAKIEILEIKVAALEARS